MIIPFILTMLFSFLFLFPQQSLDASSQGLVLWFDTLLPTLLPFLILSQLILKTSAVTYIQRFFAPFLKKLFHCSEEGVFCILCGFLCGYPVGARLIALALDEKRITLNEAQYLLSFCNNVSPIFCISYGILYAIKSTCIFPYLLFIYGSSIAFGFFTRPKTPFHTCENITHKKQTSTTENLFQLIDVCIIDSFLIMIKLCGYLILFSIINKGITLIIPGNLYLHSIILSFLEITGGLSLAEQLPDDMLRQAICVSALSFGGLCCLFQTNSVICHTKLSLKKYFYHKTLIAILAFCFFILWNFFFLSINSRC